MTGTWKKRLDVISDQFRQASTAGRNYNHRNYYNDLHRVSVINNDLSENFGYVMMKLCPRDSERRFPQGIYTQGVDLGGVCQQLAENSSRNLEGSLSEQRILIERMQSISQSPEYVRASTIVIALIILCILAALSAFKLIKVSVETVVGLARPMSG